MNMKTNLKNKLVENRINAESEMSNLVEIKEVLVREEPKNKKEEGEMKKSLN